MCWKLDVLICGESFIVTFDFFLNYEVYKLNKWFKVQKITSIIELVEFLFSDSSLKIKVIPELVSLLPNSTPRFRTTNK